jgi:hypothetical protein
VERLILAVALLAAAVAVAAVVRRRTAPTAPIRTGSTVPHQLDRADFDRPDAPWLVAAFSSRTCLSCAGTWEKVALLESDQVAVQDVAWQERRDLHDRYGVESVPVVLVADAEGTVVRSFVGPPSAADLWAAVASARDEPSTGS